MVAGADAFVQLVGDIGSAMDTTRRHLVAASYSFGKRDFPKLFRYYNRSRSGVLDWSEFRAMIRKDGRMTEATMTERAVSAFPFCVPVAFPPTL